MGKRNGIPDRNNRRACLVPGLIHYIGCSSRSQPAPRRPQTNDHPNLRSTPSKPPHNASTRMLGTTDHRFSAAIDQTWLSFSNTASRRAFNRLSMSGVCVCGWPSSDPRFLRDQLSGIGMLNVILDGTGISTRRNSTSSRNAQYRKTSGRFL